MQRLLTDGTRPVVHQFAAVQLRPLLDECSGAQCLSFPFGSGPLSGAICATLVRWFAAGSQSGGTGPSMSTAFERDVPRIEGGSDSDLDRIGTCGFRTAGRGQMKISHYISCNTGGITDPVSSMGVMRSTIGPMRSTGPASPQFLELYEGTFREVYSYVASRVGDRGAAEDVTQEVFVAAASHFARGGSIDVAWLKTVARNKLIDHWRTRARENRKLELAYSARTSPTAHESRPADPDLVTKVLADLNPNYRAALVLRHLDGLSVPEVAALISRSIEATEQVLSRARAAFRSAYAEASGVSNE